MDALTPSERQDERPLNPASAAGAAPAQSVRIGPVVLFLALCWIAALALIVQTTVPTDVGWYLVSTRKWLAGAELYTGIVEVNPPLAFYLIVPAIWVSDTGLLGPQTALFVYVALLIAVSVIWCCRLIFAASISRRFSALICLSVLSALFIVPFDDFGQREHFAIIFTLPLVMMTAFLGRTTPAWQERVAIGLFALFGLALKPFFLAAPLLMTIAHISLQRTLASRVKAVLSPENLTIGVGCIGYLAFVWFYHPAYFEVLIPLARATYIGIEHEFAGFMRIAALMILVVFPLALFIWARSANPEDRPVMVMFAATAGFVVAYLVQSKGWYYHALPAVACAVVAGAYYAGARLSENRWSLTPGLVLLAVAYVGVINPLLSGAYIHPETTHILDRHAERFAGRKIAGWTPKIETSFPLVNMVDGEWTVRYPSLWPLAGALKARSDPDPAKQDIGRQAIDDLRRNLVDDLISQRPDFVLLPTGLGENFLNLLRVDSRFDPAFAEFQRIDTIDEIEIWERQTP